MEWEQPQPIKPKPKHLTPTFGQLKKAVRMHCQCLSESKAQRQSKMEKMCIWWREEQFRQAVMKQCAHIAAQEALCWQARWRCKDCGAAPPA